MVLEALFEHKLVPRLVVSKPDRPLGRGLHLSPMAVSIFAARHKIPLIKPESLKSESVRADLTRAEADLFIVADYGRIIPSAILAIPKILPLCLHPSFLPFYRGPAPIEYVLLNGDKETGVTVFKVSAKVDAGDLILRRKVAIDYQDDFFTLSRKLAAEGVRLLVEAIAKIEAKNYKLVPQDDSLATYTAKITKADGKIVWGNPAEKLRNLIRATPGWPSAYTYYRRRMVKILSAEVNAEKAEARPGTILAVRKEGISVATSQGILVVKRLKPEGKKEMDSWSFASGYKIKARDRFLSAPER